MELVAVEETRLRVRGMDLLDGTPILDIKPYVPYADAFPTARAGWIDAIDAAQGRQSAPGPRRPRKTPPADASNRRGFQDLPKISRTRTNRERPAALDSHVHRVPAGRLRPVGTVGDLVALAERAERLDERVRQPFTPRAVEETAAGRRRHQPRDCC